MNSSPLFLPLALATALAMLQATVIGLTRFYLVGTKKMTYADFKPGEAHGPRWYGSLNRSYVNMIESLVMFAPAILLTLGREQHSLWSTLAWTFVAARVVYTAMYVAMGYQIMCSFIWLVSFGATAVLWITLAL